MKYNLHESDKQLLQENDCDVIISKGTEIEDYIDNLRKYYAIFVRNELVTPAMIDEAVNLKVIAKHGGGYDNINVEYATEKGIQVAYVPQGNINSVEDMTMLHILSCARKLRDTQRKFFYGNYNIRFQVNKVICNG